MLRPKRKTRVSNIDQVQCSEQLVPSRKLLKIIETQRQREIREEFDHHQRYQIDGGRRPHHTSVFCCCEQCFNDPKSMSEPLAKDDMKRCLESKLHFHLKIQCYNRSFKCALCSSAY
jgi:hypothetical protein